MCGLGRCDMLATIKDPAGRAAAGLWIGLRARFARWGLSPVVPGTLPLTQPRAADDFIDRQKIIPYFPIPGLKAAGYPYSPLWVDRV